MRGGPNRSQKPIGPPHTPEYLQGRYCPPLSVFGVGLDDLKVEVVDDALHDVAGGDLGVADLGLVAQQLPGKVPALPRRLRHTATALFYLFYLVTLLVTLVVLLVIPARGVEPPLGREDCLARVHHEALLLFVERYPHPDL